MFFRLLFAFAPAVFVTLVTYGAAHLMGFQGHDSFWLAAMMFFIFGGLGWSATTPRPERGEGRAARATGAKP